MLTQFIWAEMTPRLQNPFIDVSLILQPASWNQAYVRASKLPDIYKCKIGNYN